MKKTRPFISIITPTLNDKRKLKKLIANLGKQTFRDFEHIIADGGSTDGTVEYLKSIKKIDKILVSRDLSMYRGINNALRFCKGKMIGYINSDDLFVDREYLKKIHNAFLKEKIDCIYAGYQVRNIDKGTSKKYIPLKFKNRYLVTLGMPFCQHTFFWNSKFKKQRFNLNYKVCADFEFIGKILLKSRKIGFLNINSAIFHKYKKSFGEKNKYIGLSETIKIKNFFKKKLNFIFIFYITDRIFNFLNNFNFYSKKLYIISKN